MNTTTLYAYLLKNMPLKRIVALRGHAYDRDFIDHAERRVEVTLHADGTVTVDGRAVLTQSARELWIDLMAETTKRTGELPERLYATDTTIGRLEGHALHKLLGQNKIADHYAFASNVTGRTVEHLRDLTHDEAHRVRMALIFGVAA